MAKQSEELLETLQSLEQKLIDAQKKMSDEVKWKQRSDDFLKSNLEAFKEFDNKIYEAFEAYKPSPDYQVFYTGKGYLNIVEPGQALPVYGDDPMEQIERQIDEGMKQQRVTTMSFARQANNLKSLHLYCTNELVDMREANEKKYPLSKSLPDTIPAIVIMGLGLAYFLPELLKRVKPKYIYIYEPNPDFFFGALQAQDWQPIFDIVQEHDLVINFSIGYSAEDFAKEYGKFVTFNGRYTAAKTFYFTHYPSENIALTMKALKENYVNISAGWGFFDDGIQSIANGLRNLQQKLPFFLNGSKLPNQFVDVPVFIVGNGPSFDNSLPYIREYQDRAIVISCGSALTAFHRAGIKPDIHVEVERVYSTYSRLNHLYRKDPAFFKGIWLLSNNILHPDVFSLFDEIGVGIKGGEAMSTLFQRQFDPQKRFGLVPVSNPTVANMALSWALNFGFHDIYLHGIDCGFRDKEQHHAKHSAYYSSKGEDRGLFKKKEHKHFEVPANFGGKVLTESIYDLTRTMLNRLIVLKKASQKFDVFNTADGAKIEGALSLDPEHILISVEPKLKHEALEHLKLNCFESFYRPVTDKEEISKLISVEAFDELIDELIKLYETDFPSRSDFISRATKVSRFVLDFRGTNLEPLFYMLEGTLYTMNAFLMEFAYLFEDEVHCLELLNKGRRRVHQFYVEAKERYHHAYDYVDKVDFDYMYKYSG